MLTTVALTASLSAIGLYNTCAMELPNCAELFEQTYTEAVTQNHDPVPSFPPGIPQPRAFCPVDPGQVDWNHLYSLYMSLVGLQRRRPPPWSASLELRLILADNMPCT